jgi:hypothetical protein
MYLQNIYVKGIKNILLDWESGKFVFYIVKYVFKILF